MPLLYWKGFILSITKGFIRFNIEKVASLVWTWSKRFLRVDMVNVLVLMAWLVTMVAGQNDKLRLSPAAGPTFKQWLQRRTLNQVLGEIICNLLENHNNCFRIDYMRC